MRNSTIAIFLAALAGNACAGWTVTAKDDTQTAYADIDNIRHIGSTARMWTMMDFATPKSLPGLPKYVSTVRLQEFDCIEKRARVLQSSAYERKMRSGERLFNDDTPSEWKYVEPNTFKEGWLKLACEKK